MLHRRAFVLSVDLSVIIGQQAGATTTVIGVAIFVAGLLWYLAAQTTWFASKGKIGRGRALLYVVAMVAFGFIALASGTLATLAVMQ
jgi:hypothetical protein